MEWKNLNSRVKEKTVKTINQIKKKLEKQNNLSNDKRKFPNLYR